MHEENEGKFHFQHDFVCGPDNPSGLHLVLDYHDDYVSCDWTITENFVGYDGIFHGGIAASILDDLMIHACHNHRKLDVVTATITVNYRNMAHVGDKIHGEGRITSWKKGSRAIHTEAKLFAGDRLIADATGVNVIVKDKINSTAVVKAT